MRNPLALLPVLAALSAAALGAQQQKPNILFIFSDDHAYQAISAYGSNRNQTPNIDRLAREGMLFRNALVTNSICAPSRAVILTGKYSHLNTVADNRDVFDGSQQTFPKILRQNGYQTAIVGKWHLKSEPTGFDFWEVLPGQGHYYNPDFRTAQGTVTRPGYVTDVIADRVMHWLEEERDPSKPFLMMYQNKAPHRNWMPAPRHLALFDGITMPEPLTLFDDYSGRATPAGKQEMEIDRHMNFGADLKVKPPDGSNEQRAYDANIGRLDKEQRAMWDAAYEPKNAEFRAADLQGRELVRWKYQRYIKDYLRCIAAVDENVGRILRWLDANGLAENTVVMYSSDQGFYLGEHGWFDKRWMYEESLKTPLLARWPGVIAKGSVNTDLVSNVDFPETFLDLAGAPIPADMQGRSLAPVFKGRTPTDWRNSFYYHYYEGPPVNAVHNVARHDGVRTARYKLIHYYIDGEWELFDLEKDPMEMQSVYGDPAYADIQAELTRELAKLRKDLKVPEKDKDLENL
ncbi:MAG: sulfatase-like hydrolase/transferase [Acidobacteria bacterium]|nr:sulfatase-like hydrolase/transferase [Acidobacteriota bacterium]